jgi:hypothetical protein
LAKKKTLVVPYKLVCIEWDDHFSTQGWVSPKDCGRKCKAVSIGWLVKENKENYYLSTTHMAGGVVCDPIAIMKAAVTSYLDLTQADVSDVGKGKKD